MAESWQTDIPALLKRSRICFLATEGSGGPETSMAPYAVHHGNILLHLSQLAKHTGNIAARSAAGLMICTPETLAESPLALPRLALQGEIAPVAEGEYEAAKQAYLQAIPDAEGLFAFADFNLYQFVPVDVHWVGGFGKAQNIPLERWKKIFHIDVSRRNI